MKKFHFQVVNFSIKCYIINQEGNNVRDNEFWNLTSLKEREDRIMNTWSKVEELMDFVKNHDIKEMKSLLNKKEEEKSKNVLLWVFAAIGVVVAVAAIAYAVYRYMTPDYLEDFEDDFDDDFEDDFFEDEEDEESEPVVIKAENPAEEGDFAE